MLTRRIALDTAIAASSPFRSLAPRDRAFARLMVATVLRRLGETDARIDGFLRRELPPRSERLRDALRLGAVQIDNLGTPPHAAVDTTVRLLDGPIGGFRGLANAVLRRAAREPRADHPDAGRRNTPGWLWQSWEAAYGGDTAAAIAEAHLREPPLDISVARDAERWRQALDAVLLPNGTLRRPIGDPTSLPGFAEGAWWVQDAGATLPARLLGDVTGRRVIDLCAAPGGKTAQLAAAGAGVVAVDRSGPRLARMRENLARLGVEATLVEADAASWRPETPADLVLLDAPCSATGTIRRHPDIQHIKTPADVARLAALQDRLLRAAVAMTAPGGRIVFATCSLQPEEGLQRVATLLAGGAPVAIDPVRPEELPDLEEAICGDGTVRTLPCHWSERGGIDGFFIARLRRT